MRTLPVVRIRNSAIYAPGVAQQSRPIISNLTWTVQDNEAWAIIEHEAASFEVSKKTAIIKTLLSQMRLSPPGQDPLPFLNGEDARESVHSVAFSTRPRSWGSEFVDYTARYGAARGEDARTFRHVLLEAGAQNATIDDLAGKLEVRDLLDLPLVALSNGQTRRARVMQALLRTPSPKLLILDEPLTGLDPRTRPILSSLLRSLHEAKSPRILLALRPQDPLPEWVTHVLKLSHGTAETISAAGFMPTVPAVHSRPNVSRNVSASSNILAELQGVNISYGDRHVLRDISWTIRAAERWHLQGYNGSGKTTLTSLLTGVHPQSYTQSHLHLFGQPRKRIPTPTLAQRIGHTSPEIASAAPRRSDFTTADLIGTGYDGHFSWRSRTSDERQRVASLMDSVELLDKPVTALEPGEHACALLLRALVAKPELVVLDEAFMGMSKRQVDRATELLRTGLGREQAVVWIGHWEGECPWDDADGIRRIRLDAGRAEVLL
ncbi:P-loop containing nucleoside triphosphate hydrolase protein [Auriculariales sp. MPI-PUGE-AT-0066]|nr:P-loop containing nucleoside triphosphate hydrolase protein [Auriculariales sp. MPI-PUGE-AT-0066]